MAKKIKTPEEATNGTETVIIETPVEAPKVEETPVEAPKVEETPVEAPKEEETPVETPTDTRTDEEKKRGVKQGEKRGPYNKGEKTPPNSADDDFNKFKSEYKKKDFNAKGPDGKPVKKPIEINRSLVSGFMLLMACDLIIPSVLKLVIGMFNQEVKKTPLKQYKLTADEKKELTPSADEVAKIIFQNLSPIAQFTLNLTIIYSFKFMSPEEATENELLTKQK